MVSQKVDAMNWFGFEPTTTRKFRITVDGVGWGWGGVGVCWGWVGGWGVGGGGVGGGGVGGGVGNSVTCDSNSSTDAGGHEKLSKSV